MEFDVWPAVFALESNFTLGEDAYYIKRTQHVHYLGMPLHVSYKWLDVKNWTIYSSLGGSLQIPVYGKTDEKYVVGLITSCTNHWHFIPSLQWSVSTGIGVQYKLATKWSVYIEPSLHWYVPNGSSVHTIWTEHPFAENGGYPPTQNGDIRSLFWLFSLMALQN